MADYVTTGSPYFIPSPVEAMPPDIPKDLATLARSVSDNLAVVDKNLAAVKLTADNAAGEVTKLNTLTKPPTQINSFIKNASGFLIPWQRAWRWGMFVAIEVQVQSTIARAAGSGDVKDITMGTWTTTLKGVGGNFPITSMVEGYMATGYASSAGIVLSTLEAGATWAKNGKIRFAGFFLTNIART